MDKDKLRPCEWLLRNDGWIPGEFIGYAVDHGAVVAMIKDGDNFYVWPASKVRFTDREGAEHAE